MEKVEVTPQRKELAKMFADMGLNTGAEIGVERGEFAEVLCKANPKLKLYCIDAWKAYKGYRDHTNQTKLNSFYEKTKETLAPYDVEIIKAWSMEAVDKFKDGSLDFVYIDANHDFGHVAEDIYRWSKKVRSGGIVSGHDYVKRRSSIECQVKDVVDAWCYTYKLEPHFTDDSFHSWWYINP